MAEDIHKDITIKMTPWAVVYTAVDADGKTETRKNGTPVFYMHPHEDLSFVDVTGIAEEDFDIVFIRYKRFE